jgi:large subunit ribosomal protein L25
MKTISLSGVKRNALGKKDTSVLRREGKVPCVLYGGKEAIQFSAIEKDFKSIVYTPDVHLVKLDVGGKQAEAVLKDIQYHPITDSILHVDFLEVLPDKPIVMEIPIRFIGTSVGVKEGGKMLKKLTKAKVKGLISKLPGSIDINVESLKIGGYVRIKDIVLDGVTLLHEPNVTIVSVKVTREVAETPVAAAPAATGTAATPAKEEKKDEKKK